MRTFSASVKEELAGHVSKARHCQVAELGAILTQLGKVEAHPLTITVQTENQPAVDKIIMLLGVLYGEKFRFESGKEAEAVIRITDEKEARRLLTDIGFLREADGHIDPFMPEKLLERSCCQRAYIRGSFLASGSINNPSKNYHIEFLSSEKRNAERLQRFLADYEIESRIIARSRRSHKAQGGERTYYVLYLKNGEQIVDVLAVMKAQNALMELENVRIVKDVRNKVNRQVNCETANLNRTVSTSVKQTADIQYLMDHHLLNDLRPELVEMARVRMENPNVPLGELGRLLDPPVSKSGVYHRLKKLSEAADRHRQPYPADEENGRP